MRRIALLLSIPLLIVAVLTIYNQKSGDEFSDEIASGHMSSKPEHEHHHHHDTPNVHIQLQQPPIHYQEPVRTYTPTPTYTHTAPVQPLITPPQIPEYTPPPPQVYEPRVYEPYYGPTDTKYGVPCFLMAILWLCVVAVTPS